MNALLLFVALALLPTTLFGQDHEREERKARHHAKLVHNSVSVGAGAEYSFGHNCPGINVRAYYNIGEHLCFGPEVSGFMSDDDMALDVSAVVHYIIDAPWVGIYPVAGINWTQERDRETGISEGRPGGKFGAGIHRHWHDWTAFFEYTHLLSAHRDHFLTFGVMYTLHPFGQPEGQSH